MENISIVEKCVGCRACEQICPTKCISMTVNEQGFLVSKVKEEECINCQLCQKKCPLLGSKRAVSDKKSYILRSNKLEEVLKSASGAVFGTVARKLFEQEWEIFGCIFDENMKAIIKKADNIDEIEKMCGSKYVSSDTRATYTEVKKLLKNNKKVLYTGLPCQCAGLKKFLGISYQNLFTMEVICHGVPSQKLFDKYIEFIQYKYHSKVNNCNFRTKKVNNWGEYILEINLNRRDIFIPSQLDLYYKMFFSSKYFKESCYFCKYASSYRAADITIGDAWGEKLDEKDKKGLSCLIINNEHGKELFNYINKEFKYKESDYEVLSKSNIQLKKPSEDCRKGKNYYEDIENKTFLEIAKTGDINIKYRLLKILRYKIKLLKYKIMK